MFFLILTFFGFQLNQHIFVIFCKFVCDTFNYKHYRKNFNNLGIKIAINSSKTVKNIINDKNNNIHIKSDDDIYAFQCVIK